MIDNKFEGNYDKWIEYYSQIRDNIIKTIENSENFIQFNRDDFSKYTNLTKFTNIGDVNIYNESNVGKEFLSIDLKKANFQAFNFHNPNILLNSKSYEEFIGKFTDIDYIKNSKYTRQVIFGKLNPRRQVQIEKYLLHLILDLITNFMLYDNNFRFSRKLISYKSDELVFDVTKYIITDKIVKSIIDEIKFHVQVDVHVEYFKLNLMKFEDHLGHLIPVYEKEIYGDVGTEPTYELKMVPLTFHPQIFKIYNNLPIRDNDLVFYHEHQLAKFMYPLKLIEKKYKI
jgi:hypothetical protein